MLEQYYGEKHVVSIDDESFLAYTFFFFKDGVDSKGNYSWEIIDLWVED